VQCRTAGPAVEAIWQDFRGTGVIRAVGIECWNGSTDLVQQFIAISGYSFPVLMNGGYLQSGGPPQSYGTVYDNYVVIDKDGIVRYTSEIETRLGTIGRFRDATLRDAIRAWLPLAIEPRSWSGIKEMYR
jgi:hypothetical protein